MNSGGFDLGRFKSVDSYMRWKAGLERGRHTRWYGNLKIPAHCHPLVRKLFEILNEQKCSSPEVSEKAGFNPDLIRKWGRMHSPDLAHFDAVLNVLGYRLTIVRERWRPRGPTTPAADGDIR